MKVAQSCPTLCDPMDYIVHGILQARILEWVAVLFSRVSSQPGIEPRSPTLQVDSSPAKPQGKSKNAGMGSLSHLQWIFPTQELNRGLLHCRWILYQLSYEKKVGQRKKQAPRSPPTETKDGQSKVQCFHLKVNLEKKKRSLAIVNKQTKTSFGGTKIFPFEKKR